MSQMEIFMLVIIIIIVFRFSLWIFVLYLSLVKISQVPLDVKLSKENIFVLDVSNPCLHLFSYNHILQKSVISRGEGMRVINPWNFFIDQTDNILISVRGSNFIHIFNEEFQLIHKIFVSPKPMGITVD